jgi:uncharacterized protein (TIGR00645 family)
MVASLSFCLVAVATLRSGVVRVKICSWSCNRSSESKRENLESILDREKRLPHKNGRVQPEMDRPPSKNALASFIFLSRWLQAPLYVGLVVAQGVYVYRFVLELWHLIGFGLFEHDAPSSVPKGVDDPAIIIMLLVLGLIDVVMIANLLIMVIVGGYETFVSRLNLQGHPDQPEWLSHVNAGVLKVKLATALIGISSIHLLKTFINPQSNPSMTQWQVIIHLTFVFSAIALAWIDRLAMRSEEKLHAKAG